MPQSLLVVGSIAFDTVRTPHGEAKDVLGGSAVYFSVAASFFAPVRLVGVVGEDFPEGFRSVLEARSIDTGGLHVVPGGLTFRWHGSYEGAMDVATTEEVNLNVFGDFRPEIPEAFRQTDLVFLANGSPVTQMAVLEQIRKPVLAVADTMNLWIETSRDELLALLGQIDGIVLNDAEARMLSGETNLMAAAHEVLDLGPDFVIIKKGEHGALLVTDDEAVCLPAWPSLSVRDPTGAGDSFAGGMMGYLAALEAFDPEHLKPAMACGTVTASFNIEDFSLRRFEGLSREELDRRLNAYRRMLSL